jgi:DNA polymerase-3 subunit epsilon
MIDDLSFREKTFITVDFETLTPAGRKPEPIEIAMVAQRLEPQGWRGTGDFESLMHPPADVRVSGLNTAQTGFTAAMLASSPSIDSVMTRADHFFSESPRVLVAHNAPYEANLLFWHRNHCPELARTALLDTVKLARAVYPELAHHRLDDVLTHARIPLPVPRHRAMPDAKATADLFAHLIEEGFARGLWSTLDHLMRVAGLVPKVIRLEAEAAKPRQGTLFD